MEYISKKVAAYGQFVLVLLQSFINLNRKGEKTVKAELNRLQQECQEKEEAVQSIR